MCNLRFKTAILGLALLATAFTSNGQRIRFHTIEGRSSKVNVVELRKVVYTRRCTAL
jgi:hypothetical protein